MQKLNPMNYRTMPWKNQQGITHELLIEPPQGSLDDFEWRISCADIHADGEFSIFSGVDRSLLFLSGAGVCLDVHSQRDSVLLTTASDPFVFSGDVPIYSRLLNGSVSDFNVMTRRSHWKHQLEKIQFNTIFHVRGTADKTLIYHAEGTEFIVHDSVQQVSLLQGELLVLSTNASNGVKLSKNICFEMTEAITIYIVSLHRVIK